MLLRAGFFIVKYDAAIVTNTWLLDNVTRSVKKKKVLAF